jgi:hypothetical protein
MVAIGAAHFGTVAPPPAGIRAERLLWTQLGEVQQLLPLLERAETDRDAA